MEIGQVHYEKAGSSTAANVRPFGDMDGGYFSTQRETAHDRGPADVNAELRNEAIRLRELNASLIAENDRLTAALDAISGTIAIYLARQK